MRPTPITPDAAHVVLEALLIGGGLVLVGLLIALAIVAVRDRRRDRMFRVH
jgi:hypothetical protein